MTKGIQLLNRNLICKKCGVKSQKWGKCWEEGLCGKCKKKGNLICKECGAESNHIGALCWKENLCGMCFRRKESPKRYVKNTLCVCGEILVALRYFKRGISVNTGCKICTKCSTIFTIRNKYNEAMLR